MKTVLIGGVVLVAVAAAAALFFRLVSVEVADAGPRPDPQPPGEYALAGGYYAVRPAASVDLAALEDKIAATARTKHLAGSASDLPMAYVHRSWFWGFPDVTQVWVEDGNVHIYSHLVYGGSDLGVNRNRMQAWLTQ